MMEHEEVRDLIPAFALGAVDPNEADELESHLATCDACRSVLETYRTASEAMARAVPPADLPAGFADRVVSAAVGDRSPAGEGARRRWSRFAIAMTAAVVVACIAVAGTVIEARNDSERRSRALAILASNEGIGLTGGDNISGRIVPTDDGSRFAIAGVGPAPEGRTYQLWLMRGDDCPDVTGDCELVSAGTFETEDQTAVLDIDLDVDEWENAAVSTEPEAGSKVPSTTPFADSFT